MLIKIHFALSGVQEKLQNVMINQTDSNTIIIGTELEWGFNMRGAYNWTYFSFTVDGPITGGLMGGSVVTRELNFPPACFITFFYKCIFRTFIDWKMVVVQPLQ